MGIEGWISIGGILVCVGTYIGMLRAIKAQLDKQDRVLDKIHDKMEEKASKSDHEELKTDFKRLQERLYGGGPYRPSYPSNKE